MYVHGGEVGGLLVRVKRTGSAADRLATTVSDPLVTHVDAARTWGERLLAAQHQQPDIASLTLPLGGDFPHATLGQLLRLQDGPRTVLGVVSSIEVNVQLSGDDLRIQQTLGLGEDTPNTWSRLQRLLPADPEVAGRVIVDHQDGTVTVELFNGGTQRVRGTGPVGRAVYVQGRRVIGEAPDLPMLEVEV